MIRPVLAPSRAMKPHPLAVFLFGLAAAPVPAQFAYGTGTPGTGGLVPSLTCRQPWAGRSTFTVDIANAYGGAGGLVVFGLGQTNQTLFGLPVYVDPSTLLASSFVLLGGSFGTPGAGAGSLALPLTAAGPSLIGFTLRAQALLFDPAGPGFGGGWTASNGLSIRLSATPQVFVACSVGGSTDPHWAVNGLTRALDFSGGNGFTDNVDGAVYTDDGRDLYLSSGFGQAAHADLSSGTPVWSWLNTSIGTTGVAWDNCVIDREHQLLWMMGQSGSSVELLALDIDKGSPGYGQILHRTSTLSATIGLLGVWGMSHDRKLAAVPSLLGGSLHLVDTDPASPTFLQIVSSSPIPPSSLGSPLTFSVRIRFSPDDTECFVLLQNAGATPGEIAHFLIPAGIWFDHDPATPVIDHIGPNANPPLPFGSAPLGFDVGRDGAIYLTGWSGAGFAGRVLVAGPTAFYTPLNATSSLQNARNIALNRDQDLLAVAVANPNTTILFFDAATLNEIGSIGLGSTVDTTVLSWR